MHVLIGIFVRTRRLAALHNLPPHILPDIGLDLPSSTRNPLKGSKQ